MTSRYDVVLNGKHMNKIDKNLLVLNVTYPEYEYTQTTYTPAGSEVVIIDNRKKAPAKVNVTFELHLYSITERQEALVKVIEWCKDGGTLKVNDRPGQQLRVVCEQLPAMGSVRDWTAPLTITFASYSCPYWEDDKETVITLQGVSARADVTAPGNAEETLVSAEITSMSKNVEVLYVAAGKSTVALEGISLPVNGRIKIGYDNHGIFYIRQGSKSILDKRTAISYDDLRLPCGSESVLSITASAKVKAVFKFRGRWL